MPALRLFLLGSPRVERAGQPVSIELRKAVALLVYLAVTKQSHSRDVLATLFWPELNQSRARAGLRYALVALKKALAEGRADDEYPLDVDRETVGLNHLAEIWLDVDEFQDLLGRCRTHDHPEDQVCPTCLRLLATAANLYHADFLAGFTLRDSPTFDEWQFFQTEGLRNELLGALARLAQGYADQGEFEPAITHARRWAALDPLHEPAHRQLMRLYARSGQRPAALRQYETCCRALRAELSAEPGAETRSLFEQIRAGEPEVSVLSPERSLAVLPERPAFLTEDEDQVASPRPVFVARERELAQLDAHLAAALDGHGRVVFVTGEAGCGKTALMDAFARRAMEVQPHLLVASGNCNAYSGIGDPYLPFREVMGMLTGDVEAKWATGAISRDQALRLWGALPLVVQALLDHGPHVVPALVPGAALLSRAVTVAPAGALWLQRLRERVERQPADSEGLEQSSLFQQVSNVLHKLAEAQPLLLAVDDLQWADSASIGLLFHLGRRLEGSRILIACAYRPEEVAPPEDPVRSAKGPLHSLGNVLTEFKRLQGDVWVDLAGVQEQEGRQFVDALLETEPNRLGDGFRRALFAHAGGHPLFTIELLRAMQDRGDLVRDEQGHWLTGPALDWDTLPSRVEGVIEARVGRLDRSLRDFLSVASVEGEEFTAQLVAQVQEVGERQALRWLSQELDKHHRLVREQSALRVGGRRLSRYRFSHGLFQQYLYHDLSGGERALLHGGIAGVLEELYHGHLDEVAVTLAHHYSEAGDAQRTLKYLILAGDWAQASCANSEAIDYYSRALELAPADDAKERYALLLKREKVYDLLGAQEERAREVAALEALAEALDTAQGPAGWSRQAEAALRRAVYEELSGDLPASIAAAQTAVRLARQAGDLGCEAKGRNAWAKALTRQGEYETARQQFEQALALARQCGARRVEAGSLYGLGWVLRHEGMDTSYFEEALDLYRECGDRRGEARILVDLGVRIPWACQGDLPRARVYYERALGIYREIGDLAGEVIPLANIGWVYWGEDDYAGARASSERALALSREVGQALGEAQVLAGIGETVAAQGHYALGEARCRQALPILREIGAGYSEVRALLVLGLIRFQQGDYARARAFLEESRHLLRDIGWRWEQSRTLTLLGLVCHAQGDDEAARDHAQQALENGPAAYHLLQGDSALVLGHALAGLGDRAGATAAYRQALDRYRQSGWLNPPMEALAGLARLALAGGELSQAMVYVHEILEHLKAHTLDGTYEPFRIYWTCYRVLKAHDDPRAAEVLRTAYRLLQERAARIEQEDLRRSFLEGVPAHRKLIQESQRLGASSPEAGRGGGGGRPPD